MRIVQNNNTITVTCQHCKSVLAVTVEDIKDSMGFGTYVVCAACDRQTQVMLSQIPQDWRNKIDWDE